MKKKICLALSLTILMTLIAGGAVASHDGQKGKPHAKKMLAAVRRATAGFHKVQVAEAAGYVSTEECVSVPGLGGMGIHYVNFGLLGDGEVDALQPEVLLYEPRGDHFRLVGVEYVMMALWDTGTGAAPWFDHDPPPGPWVTTNPELFGQTFAGPMPGHGEGEPWHYELHAWVWRHNPRGIFADFNTKVSCPAH